ncbi:MAG: hypothetical protein ACRDKT_10420 [Actinomycetota bacterium]
MAPDPHAQGFQALVDGVTGSQGELKAAVRQALFEGGEAGALERFAGTVERHAYKVTDSMVQDLKAAGYTEDHIFEAAVAVSVRAAAIRLEANERAMEGTG